MSSIAVSALANRDAGEVVSVQPAAVDGGATVVYGILRQLGEDSGGTVFAVQVTAAEPQATTTRRRVAGGEPCPDCTATHYFLVEAAGATPEILGRRAPGPVTYIHLKGGEYALAGVRLSSTGDGTPRLAQATLLETGFVPSIFKRRIKVDFDAAYETGSRADEIARMARADAMERDRQAQRAYEAAVERHSPAQE